MPNLTTRRRLRFGQLFSFTPYPHAPILTLIILKGDATTHLCPDSRSLTSIRSRPSRSPLLLSKRLTQVVFRNTSQTGRSRSIMTPKGSVLFRPLPKLPPKPFRQLEDQTLAEMIEWIVKAGDGVRFWWAEGTREEEKYQICLRDRLRWLIGGQCPRLRQQHHLDALSWYRSYSTDPRLERSKTIVVGECWGL